MKNILCFGDSNTFGYIPENGRRYDKNTRWTGVLQRLCKDDYEITEAGCNNRTCFMDNPCGINFTGYKILPSLLNKRFDIIILSIGINDIQKLYNPPMEEVKRGIEKLILISKEKLPKAKIIIVSPPRLTNDVLNGSFSFQFDKTSIEKSLLFAEIYKKTAKKNGCLFFDLDKIITVSPVDGLHYSEETHNIIAHSLYDFILNN